MEKREMIAALLRADRTVKEICLDLNVSRSFVFKVKKLIKDGKDLALHQNSGRPRTSRAACAVAEVLQRVRCPASTSPSGGWCTRPGLQSLQ